MGNTAGPSQGSRETPPAEGGSAGDGRKTHSTPAQTKSTPADKPEKKCTETRAKDGTSRSPCDLHRGLALFSRHAEAIKENPEHKRGSEKFTEQNSKSNLFFWKKKKENQKQTRNTTDSKQWEENKRTRRNTHAKHRTTREALRSLLRKGLCERHACSSVLTSHAPAQFARRWHHVGSV